RKNTGFSQWIQQSWRAQDAPLIQKSTRDFAASGRFDNAPLQQIMFALVARQSCCSLECGARFCETGELEKQITAHAFQQMIALERRFVREIVHNSKCSRRAFSHADRYRAVEF